MKDAAYRGFIIYMTGGCNPSEWFRVVAYKVKALERGKNRPKIDLSETLEYLVNVLCVSKW